MTSGTDGLFDPDEFRSKQDSGREPRKRAGRRRYGVEPGSKVMSPGWWIVSTVAEGHLPGLHQVDVETELGSVITKCDQTGRPVYEVPVGTDGYLCTKCVE